MKQILPSYSNVEPERQVMRSQEREHERFKIFLSFGSLVHVLLFAYFVYDQVEPLIYSSAISLAAWLASFILIKGKHYRAIVLLTSITMLVQLSLATLIYGKESGFLMGLWPLSAIFVINTNTKIILGTAFASLCLIAFICLSIFAPETTEHDILPGVREIIIIICGSFMVSAVMSIKAAFRVRRNKMIYIANHDALTGLKNRRFFSTFIAYQRDVVRREGTRYCLAIGDIDHFKEINDKFGHQMGDDVLVSMASCFSEILAQSDVICRWGGEEFLIFLPESDVGLAYPVLEAIREVISEHKVNGISATMSFGLVESDGTQSLDELVKKADILLYKAKSAGRNQVMYE